MGKKLFCILLCAVLFLPAGCRKEGGGGEEAPWKIAIITGEGGEAAEVAARLEREEPYVVRRTYPGDRSAEKTVSICAELLEDKSLRAILFVPAVAGIDEAAKMAEEKRPDVLFLVGTAAEDAGFAAQTADMVLAPDVYTMGTEIINEAYRMGAKRFIHYTFARHLLSEPFLRRRELMVERCGELGIEFIDITTPDPLTAEGGKEEARQFIEEDVPQKVGDYGANTAFFATDCTIMPELIRQVAECGAICPQTCCAGPYHGYTEMFGIEKEEYNNTQGVLRQIADNIAPYGNTGHMAAWCQSPETLMVEAGVEYARRYGEGEIKKKADRETAEAVMDGLTGGRTTLSEMAHAPNCYLFLCEYYML